MKEFEIDWAREARTGIGEAVFCLSKSAAQIDAIVASGRLLERPLLLTRLSPEKHTALGEDVRDGLDYDPLSLTAFSGRHQARAEKTPIGIVAAGTSDLPVAREAARTLAFHGCEAPVIADVGVAGLWRLMERIEEIGRFRVVIAVAGMEGALFSVLAGLVPAPVIAVPTSVGYGVGAAGMAALHSALASCAPGVVCVNVDNGFGAAVAALKMARSLTR